MRLSSRAIIVSAIVLGLALRILMLALSPKYGYVQDHDDLARWSLQAAEEGVLTLYDHPPKPAEMQMWIGDQYAIAKRDMDRLCNYPPLCVYLLAASGHALTGLSHERLVNTLASRSAIGAWSILFDILLAIGCARIGARLRQGNARHWAFVGGLLLPPFWLVSCLWGQVDTWVLAPLVWTVDAMIAGSWVRAGVFYGLAAALKPQAAALIPVWGLTFLIARPFWRPAISLSVSAATLFLIALPFTLHSGGAWWRESYQANLFEHSKGMTTLMAFNMWYLDCLFTGSVNEARTWLGITKAAWGQMGLAFVLLAGLVWMLRAHKDDRRSLAVWSSITLLAFVMIPTRVHERFILLALPFLLVTALAWRRGWLCLALLTIVGTAQVTWPQWLKACAVDWEPAELEQCTNYEAQLHSLPESQRAKAPSFEQFIRPLREDFDKRNGPKRPFEWLFALLGVAGTVVAGIELTRLRPLSRGSPG